MVLFQHYNKSLYDFLMAIRECFGQHEPLLKILGWMHERVLIPEKGGDDSQVAWQEFQEAFARFRKPLKEHSVKLILGKDEERFPLFHLLKMEELWVHMTDAEHELYWLHIDSIANIDKIIAACGSKRQNLENIAMDIKAGMTQEMLSKGSTQDIVNLAMDKLLSSNTLNLFKGDTMEDFNKAMEALGIVEPLEEKNPNTTAATEEGDGGYDTTEEQEKEQESLKEGPVPDLEMMKTLFSQMTEEEMKTYQERTQLLFGNSLNLPGETETTAAALDGSKMMQMIMNKLMNHSSKKTNDDDEKESTIEQLD